MYIFPKSNISADQLGCEWDFWWLSGMFNPALKGSANLQDLYSVYASPNYSEVYANDDSACRGNVAGSWVPENQLAVDVFGANGVVAERAWPASCTSISALSKIKLIPRFGPEVHSQERYSPLHPRHLPRNAPSSKYHFQHHILRRQLDELYHPPHSWFSILDNDL